MPFNMDDYELVEDRIARFWDKHPDGRIETEMIPGHEGDPDYIVKASIWREDLGDVLGKTELYRPSATGYAQEVPGSSLVNKTSALENCETSAVGRALANLGYAPKGKRPSREEMQKSDGAAERAHPPSDSSGEESRGVAEKAAPTTSPEHHYPADPATCDHKRSSGAPAKFIDAEKVERCQKCGLPWIVVVEGTTADLGSA